MAGVPDWISAGRYWVIYKYPYFAHALMAVRLLPDPASPTFYTNGATIWYPAGDRHPWVGKGADAVGTALYHELSHILRDHLRRMAGYERTLANIAQDCEINDDLAADHLPLIEGAVVPRMFDLPDGLLAEEYYDRLQRQLPPKLGLMHGDCYQDGKAAPVPIGDDVPPEPGPLEWELIRHQTAKAMEEHLKQRGNVPVGWQRWAQDILRPRVPWQRVLQRRIRHALQQATGKQIWTFTRPSRRQAALPDTILPTLRGLRMRIAVVIDTSGSMTDALLSQAVTEVGAILRFLGYQDAVTVLSVDAAVHTCQTVWHPRQIRLLGGGGTDMGVGIAHAQTLRPKPSVILVISDGETPWPATPVDSVLAILPEGAPDPPAWLPTVRFSSSD